MIEKYKVTIGKQFSREKDLSEALDYLQKLMELGFIKLGLIRLDDEEIALINSKKGIKPIKIDPKIKRMAETPPGKKFRKTKAEMEERRTSAGSKRTKKYPDEMKGFVERHLNQNTNQQICDLVNEKWGLEITKERLAPYMNYNKLKRNKNPGEKKKIDKPEETNKYKVGIVHLDHNGFYACNEAVNPNPNKISKDWDEINCDNCRRKFEGDGVKKIGKPKIYTDEVVKYLEDNVNNFKNKELCEELESRFNIKTTPDKLAQTLSNKGIKRDGQSDVDPEVMELINKSKEKDAFILRDHIIEKLEKNIPMNKLKNMMSQRKETFPGESEKDEVKRIEKKRKDKLDSFDESVEELELD